MSAAEVVTVVDDAGVRTITIDRPAARNSIDAAVARGIDEALTGLDDNDSLTIGVITGAGGYFSSGMDLKAFLRGENPYTQRRGFGGIVEAPPEKPLIAAIEGFAVAGGFEVALACDLIVAAQNVFFALPEVKRGLVAAGGGLLRLPTRIPLNVAMQMTLSASTLSAEEAHRYGLVNALTEPGGALAAAHELARSIAANGPLAVRATKKILTESREWPQGEAFDRQRTITVPVRESADAREGALAFTEKRAPVWRGA